MRREDDKAWQPDLHERQVLGLEQDRHSCRPLRPRHGQAMVAADDDDLAGGVGLDHSRGHRTALRPVSDGPCSLVVAPDAPNFFGHAPVFPDERGIKLGQIDLGEDKPIRVGLSEAGGRAPVRAAMEVAGLVVPQQCEGRPGGDRLPAQLPLDLELALLLGRVRRRLTLQQRQELEGCVESELGEIHHCIHRFPASRPDRRVSQRSAAGYIDPSR